MSVHVEREEGVAVVTIDRPEALNALDAETLEALRDRLVELSGDSEVRAVVLTGAGERAFAAGADIKEMQGKDVEQARAWAELGHDVCRLLETMPKPTIAAVNGLALGGGCELALACDLRYAAEGARFGQPEINLGVFPGWGGTQRLARVVGLGLAKELVLTGRPLAADEALARGLVSALHPAESLLERTLEVARALAAKAPLALAAAKELVDRSLQGDLDAALADEAAAFSKLFGSEDQREGMTAFVEKREPRFSGR